MAATSNQMSTTANSPTVDGSANSIATRVLLVEDNAADRKLVHHSLSGSPYKYRLDCAERLSEGLDKLGAQATDIILLDLNLPDSTGKETIQKVLSHAPDVPILVLTGSDDDGTALEAVRSGAQDYIVKGQFDGNALSRAVRHAIERHQVLTVLRETRQKQLEFKDKFLSHVSHELRSPLACIHQYAELMLDGLAGPLTAKERDYLGNVLRNAQQLNKLLTDLLDAARANVGKLSIETARVQPSDIINQARQMFEQKALARGISLRAEGDAHLPPVLADRGRLLQILTNLLENALKFTDEGGEVTLRARVFAQAPEFAQFTVSDTGKGIQPESLERVFDRLYQEENAVSNRQGLGLGLAICKELVERQGGTIWVESKPGVGSSFSFLVPLFSLTSLIRPLVLHNGSLRQIALVVVDISRGNTRVTEEAWEGGRRRCREVVERCILPDKDMVLPSLHPPAKNERIVVLACADRNGASILETRIRGQLGAVREIAAHCQYQSFCVSLPQVPGGLTCPDEELQWISQEIESSLLRMGPS